MPSLFPENPSVACRIEGWSIVGKIKRQVQEDHECLPTSPRRAARWGTWRWEEGRKAGTLHCSLQVDSQDPGREITPLSHMQILFTYAFLNLPPKNKANGTIIESRRFSPYVVIIFFFSNSKQANVKKYRLRGRLTEENTQPSAEGCWIFNPLIFFPLSLFIVYFQSPAVKGLSKPHSLAAIQKVKKLNLIPWLGEK